MLYPDLLPLSLCKRRGPVVTHVYPDGWTDQEVDAHRYDQCPCSPTMHQAQDYPYHWIVTHQRSLT